MEGPLGPILAQAPERIRPLLVSNQVRLSPEGAFRYLASSGKHPGAIAGVLQPTGEMASQALSMVPQVNLALTAANTVITAVGFAAVLIKLQEIQRQLRRIENRVARIEDAVQEVLAQLRSLQGAVSDLDRKLDMVRDAITREMRQHKIAEIIGVQLSLEESIRCGRWDEVPRRIDGVSARAHEAEHLLHALPMEVSPFRLELFKLAVMGRVLITRAYLVMGNEEYAIRSHEDAWRATASLAGEFLGPHGSFLGTAPTAYLLPEVHAFDPLLAEIQLDRARREEMLDYALVGAYPLTPDGERLSSLRRHLPSDAESLMRPGMTARLGSGHDLPFTLEAEVGRTYRRPDLPVSLEQNGWASVAMAYEVAAVERRLALETEIIRSNPRALLPPPREVGSQAMVIIPVDAELVEEVPAR